MHVPNHENSRPSSSTSPPHVRRTVPRHVLKLVTDSSRRGRLRDAFAVSEGMLNSLENLAVSLAWNDQIHEAGVIARGVLALDAEREKATWLLALIRDASKPVDHAEDANTRKVH